MAHGQPIVGIDIGTTKTCTVIGEPSRGGQLNVVGVGVCPSRGLRKGIVVDIDETVQSIAASLEKAERLAGSKVASAYIGVAGGHIASLNSRGVIALPRADRDINVADINRAIEAARTISIPPSREVIHVIPRSYTVDGQEGIKDPIGMSGYRLEVETHIVTGAVNSIQNLIKCVQRAGVEIDDLVLEPLASSEAVLSEAEKEMGVVLVDIGGGTTDIAIFIEGSIWHTVVLPVGGSNITNDIAIVLRLPYDQAEDLKVRYGSAQPLQVDEASTIQTPAFDRTERLAVSQRHLSEVVEARIAEIFGLVLAEIKRSGYDGLLPAGVVVTGGTAQLPGIKDVAEHIIGLPVRIGVPSGIEGLTDSIGYPAYATSVGLVFWGVHHGDPTFEHVRAQRWGDVYSRFKGWLREFFP